MISSSWLHGSLILLLLPIAGCMAPGGSESTPTETQGRPLVLQDFQGCNLHVRLPDDRPFPCGQTEAVEAGTTVPPGWSCMAEILGGSVRLWSDRESQMGLEIRVQEFPSAGTAVLNAWVRQETRTSFTAAYLQPQSFVRLPDPDSGQGEVEYWVWTFTPREHVRPFMVEAASFGEGVWYAYRADFAGVDHYFSPSIGIQSFEGRTYHFPGSIAYTGQDFAFGVDSLKAMGPADLPFDATWDEPTPVIDDLPGEC